MEFYRFKKKKKKDQTLKFSEVKLFAVSVLWRPRVLCGRSVGAPDLQHRGHLVRTVRAENLFNFSLDFNIVSPSFGDIRLEPKWGGGICFRLPFKGRAEH